MKLMYKIQYFLWERKACVRLVFHSVDWKKSKLKFSWETPNVISKNKKHLGHTSESSKLLVYSRNVLYILFVKSNSVLVFYKFKVISGTPDRKHYIHNPHTHIFIYIHTHTHTHTHTNILIPTLGFKIFSFNPSQFLTLNIVMACLKTLPETYGRIGEKKVFNYSIPKRKPRCMPFTESSVRTTQTICSRYVVWATRPVRLPALGTLHLKCQHQQATIFTVSPVTAKVDRRVGAVSLSLIF